MTKTRRRDWAIAALGVSGLRDANAQGARRTMIQYEIKATKARFAPAEPVRLALRIVNTSNAAVDLPNPESDGPDPVFAIQSPGAASPRLVAASYLFRPTLGKTVPARIAVAAGAEWKGSVTLPEGLIRGGGDHRVVSRFGSGDGVIESNAAVVSMENYEFVSAAAGYGVNPLQAGDGHLAFLHSGESSGLYRTRFNETRPSIAETRVAPLDLLKIVPKGAADVGVPLRNGGYFDEMAQWVVWREGGDVHAMLLGEEQIGQPPSPAVRLVQPPLQPVGGPVQMFVVSANPPAMSMLVMPVKGGAMEPAWTLPLQAPPEGVTAALGPAARGKEGHVVAVSNSEAGVLVEHVRYENFRIPDAFNSVLIPACSTLPGAAVGVHGNADGSGRVGLFVRSKELAFVEVSFPIGLEGKILGIRNLGVPQDAPVASAVHYHLPAGAAEARLAAVVQTAKGMWELAGDGLQPTRNGVATRPILLAPGKDVTFIVYLRANGEPYMEPL